MQVYPRIANPYMPNGTPDLTNAPSPYYAPGELGCAFNDQNTGGSYLRVQLDSGATSATPVGAVKAGQLAFWKDQTQSLVTNDPRFCDIGVLGAVNRVAGIFQLAVTAAPGVTGTDGNPQLYMTDLIIQKRNVAVYDVAGTPTAGQLASAEAYAVGTRNSCIATAISSGYPNQQVGVWTGVAGSVANTYNCDVNIAFTD